MKNQKLVLMLMMFAGFAGDVASGAAAAESQAGAVEAAERFIRENRYDTTRACPENLAKLDADGKYDMHPHCQRYTPSESTAFAIEETEIFWRVYFRKIPPACDKEGESFRVVEVFRASFPEGPRIVLKDVELFVPNDATLLIPDKVVRGTCAKRGPDSDGT